MSINGKLSPTSEVVSTSRHKVSELFSCSCKNGVLLFFATWIVYGFLINTNNLDHYRLWQLGPRTLVEKGTFQLDTVGSDIFQFEGRNYINKQPGQAVLGAIVYSIVRASGVGYSTNYFKAAAIVSWFTGSLLLAISVTLLFRIVHYLWNFSTFSALAVALTYGFATTAFAYSGIGHHDIIGNSLLLIAFYFLESSSVQTGKRAVLSAFVAGLLVTFSLFSSMLILFAVVMIGIYGLWSAKGYIKGLFLTGLIVGLLPFLIFNAYYFHNPLVTPYAASGLSHNFIDFHWKLFAFHFQQFFLLGELSLFKYAPISIFSFIGLAVLPISRLKRALLLGIGFVYCAFVLGAHDTSWFLQCQYGPRYLLPFFLWSSFGVAGLVVNYARSPIIRICCFLIWIYSFFVNFLGALLGSMFCYGDFAPMVYLARIKDGEFPSYYLFYPLLVTSLLFVFGVVCFQLYQRKEGSSAE